MNLIEVIKTIESDITSLEIKKKNELENISKDYDRKIEELKIALDINERMNTYCLNCDGRGFYMKLDSAGIDSDQFKCEQCRGSGRNLK